MSDLNNVLEMTGCRDAADLQDMANVGKALMERMADVVEHGPLKGWMPADCPTEVVTDLANEVDETRSERDAAVERLQAIIDWADLALKLPEEFNSHGVRNLDGPVFDAARAFLASRDFFAAQAEESSASVDEPRRCPSCGYTEADKRLHLDHHLCPQNKKSRARRLPTTRDA